MGTTANYAFPYPAGTDSPAGMTEIQNLAVAVDTALNTEAGTRSAVDATNAGNIASLTSTVNASGLGRLAGSLNDTTTNAASVTNTEAIKGTATVNLTNGRRYRVLVNAVINIAGTTFATTALVFVRYASGASVTTAATSLMNLEWPSNTNGLNATKMGFCEFVHSGATGQWTFGLGAQRAIGADAVLYGGGAAQPTLLSIDDIGT
jgi:hypothetical protein